MAFRRILVTLFVTLVMNVNQSSIGLASTPTYTPLLQNNFEDGSIGSTFSNWYKSVYSSTHANSGSKAVKITITDGSELFGGYNNLPSSTGQGGTVWYRAYFYFPSTFSNSYGTAGDGNGATKFLLLAPANHAGNRSYMEITGGPQLNYGDPGFANIGAVVRSDFDLNCGLGGTIPRNQWVALQYSIHLNYGTGQGYSRVWINDQFVGQCNGTLPSGWTIGEWGIGNWWNGGAWVRGGSTADFWMDDLVITNQTPNTVDSEGHPFIDPSHFVGNSSAVNSPLAAPNPPTVN